MRLQRRHNPRGGVMPIRTGTGDYGRPPNPRGCPGSWATVKVVDGWGVCPFCNRDKRVRKDGRIKAHARP